jgi:hypothetical protein
LKKRSKKLLLLKQDVVLTHAPHAVRDSEIKVFWFFFSKKNCFLAFLHPITPARCAMQVVPKPLS